MLFSSIQWLTNDTDTGGDAPNTKVCGMFRFCDTQMQVKMQPGESFRGLLEQQGCASTLV